MRLTKETLQNNIEEGWDIELFRDGQSYAAIILEIGEIFNTTDGEIYCDMKIQYQDGDFGVIDTINIHSSMFDTDECPHV